MDTDEHGGMSEKEIAANCGFLIIAGSENIGIAMSGIPCYLLRSLDPLREMTKNVREAFSSELAIDFVSASARLPYTVARINERMRAFPPRPTIAPKRTARG